MIDSAQDLPVDFPAGITMYITDKDGIHIPQAAAVDGDDAAVMGADIDISDDTTYSKRSQKVRRINVDITIATNETNAADRRDVKTVLLTIPVLMTPNPTIATADASSIVVHHTITLTEAVSTEGLPKVVSIQRLRPGSQTVVSAFQEERIVGAPFDVRIVLSAPPHGIDLAEANPHDLLVEVENGTVSGLVIGVPFTRLGDVLGASPTEADIEGYNDSTYRPHPSEGMYDHNLPRVAPGADDVNVPLPNSVDDMYRQYRVTITPHTRSADFDVKVKIKTFHDNGAQVRNTYVPPGFGDSAFLTNGRDILTIPVKGAARNLEAGYRVVLPKEIMIPAGGYLVVTKDEGGSEVVVPAGIKKRCPEGDGADPCSTALQRYCSLYTPELGNRIPQRCRG